MPAPAAPAAPFAPPGVPHVFIRCAPPTGLPELDYLRVDARCAARRALPDLGWLDAGPAHPGEVAAPALVLQAVLCLPMHVDEGVVASRTILAMSELTTMVTPGFLGQCADAYESLGVFAVVFTSTRLLQDRLEAALPRAPSPSPFLLGVGDLETPSPFFFGGTARVLAVAPVAGIAAIPAVVAVAAVRARAGVPAVRAVRGRPAVAAVAPVPGVAAAAAVPPSRPTELTWLHLVQLKARLDNTSIFPFSAFLSLGLAAPDRCSQVARSDPTSHVRGVADALLTGLCTHLGTRSSAVGDAAAARQFPAFSDALELLPIALRSHSFLTDSKEAELIDAISYSGDIPRQDKVTTARLEYIGHDYAALHAVLQRAPNRSSRATVVRTLAPFARGFRDGASLFEHLDAVDVLVQEHAAFLVQCWNVSLPVDEMVRRFRLEAAEWKSASADRHALAPETEDLASRSVSLKGVTDAALRRAIIEDERFLEMAAEVAECDLDSVAGRLEALETACLSGLAIVQRFFANPACLQTKHVVFSQLFQALSAMPQYLGKAQAAIGGEVPEERANWLFHQSQCNLLFRGALSAVSWFNELEGKPGAGGALPLANLDASEPFLNCPVEQLFIVETVLSECISLVTATMIAAGWAAASDEGYTLAALFTTQLEYVKWIRKQGDNEQEDLLPHAQMLFEEALIECSAAHGRMLSHPEPASAKLTFHLAFGGPYDNGIAEKKRGVKPIVFIRKALPSLFKASAPRSYPGVNLGAGSSSAALVTVTDALVVPGKGKGGGRGKGGEDGGRGSGKPGSARGAATWPDATHMKLGNRVYDVAAIGNHYALDKDHCFPVLLSIKKGANRLALCPHYGKEGHTSLTSAKHTTPKDFNLAKVNRDLAMSVPVEKDDGGQPKGKKQKTK